MYKKSQIYLMGALLLFIVIVFAVLVLSIFFSGGNTQPNSSPSPIPLFSPSSSSQPININPILTNQVPLRPPAEGGGVNLESQLVQDSQTEIAKISPLLPYRNNFTASSGENISILIPGTEFQTVPWVLDVEVFGINYQTNESEADYNLQKNSFLISASHIFEWLRSNGVDPEKIIINWGDGAYIRETAERWLSE